MLSKKLGSMKKLANKVKKLRHARIPEPRYQCLLEDNEEQEDLPTTTTSTGTFVVYVGEGRERFVVPMGYLSHPLFKILLDKAYNEFGFGQQNRLVVPCSVAAFQEVVNAVECCNGRFDFGDLVEEFLDTTQLD